MRLISRVIVFVLGGERIVYEHRFVLQRPQPKILVCSPKKELSVHKKFYEKKTRMKPQCIRHTRWHNTVTPRGK